MVKILKKVNEDANMLVITDDSIPTPQPTPWQACQLENTFIYTDTITDIYVSDKIKVYTLDDSLWTPVSRRFNIQAAPKEYWFIIVNNSSVSLEVYTWVNIQALLAWWKMAYVSVFNNWSQISISIYWTTWNTNDLWFFANESSLTTSHPTANNWNYAIVWTTDSIWIWDSDTNTWKDSKVTPTVNEAPIDWKLYVRKNWAWVESEVWWTSWFSFNWINWQVINIAWEIINWKIAELTAFASWTLNEIQISTSTITTWTTTVTVKKNWSAIGTATITSNTTATNWRYFWTSTDLADSFVANDVITIEVDDTGTPFGTWLLINLK